MNKILCTLILLILTYNVVFSQTESSQLSNDKIEFLIKAVEDWKSSETPKLLTFTLKNNSKSRVIAKEVCSKVSRNYTIEVKDSNGKLVPMTTEGKRLTRVPRVELSVIYVRIKSGEQITRTLNLSRLYSLKAEEKYTIKLTKSVYIESEKAYQKLNSNTIESP